MRERFIIHLNVTDFAVAVERLRDSSLRQKAVIVAPDQASRALVYDMSEEAYGDGVRKGMRLDLAKRYCRNVHVVTPALSQYRLAMRELVKQVVPYTPLVEQGAEDGHLFMDVTGTHRLFGPAPDIAWRLRKQILTSLGLDPIWSLASNKLVSKVASRLTRPSGEYIVGAGEEAAFLAPLSLSLLPGVKSAERRVLRGFNLRSIGDLALLSRVQLAVPFRKRAEHLYNISRGRDLLPVLPGNSGNEKLICEHHSDTDLYERSRVQTVLTTLVHDLGRQLRQRGKVGQRIGLKLFYSDGKSVVRQATQRGGTDNDFLLRQLALLALERAWKRRARIRSCILICDRLLPCSRQQSLFTMHTAEETQQKKILAAMDQVCSRFGNSAIRLGSS